MIYFSDLKKEKGFTLLELLTVIAIISSVSILAFPIYSNYLSDSFSKTSLLEIEAGFKKSRQKSLSSLNNSSYGIYYNKTSDDFVFYQGESYTERTNDFIVGLNKTFQVTEPQESIDINLKKGTGEPNTEQVFIFSSKDSSERKLTINKFGAIIFD